MPLYKVYFYHARKNFYFIYLFFENNLQEKI